MSNNVISNTTVIQTQTAYSNPYSGGGLSDSIQYKTTGDYINESSYKFINIILIGAVTTIMLSKYQPPLLVYSQ